MEQITENIVERIRKFVEEECKKPTSKYGYEPYSHHFVPMYNYANILGRRLNADLEIIELAAWLHDIGSIIVGRENHHITGAKIAEEKLNEFGFCDEGKIERIKNCILNHRWSINNGVHSIEEQIIVEADTLSNFNNISGIFKAAFIYENLDQQAAKEAIRKKLQNKFNMLSSQESKDLIKLKYEAVMLLFG